METLPSYILRRLVRHAACSVSTEHTEQQSNRATEHSAGHVTHRSAVLAAGRDARRRMQTPLHGASLHYLATCANSRIARFECFISSAQPSIPCNVNKSIIMPYLGRNPTVFFRVQDEYSQAQYCEHRGILSKNQSHASFDPRLSKTRQTIQDHLDWASRKSSAFISVYSDWATANREARRRLADGHENVVIWKIDTRKGHRTAQYRNIRPLALRCRIWVPHKAWNNSEHE
jgi:hypothetical protein